MLIFVTLAFLFILFVVLFLIVSTVMLLFDLLLELPYVSTNRKKIQTIMDFAKIKKGETVVDLGSGDGRLLIASAQKGAKAVGYELNPFLIIIALIHSKLEGLSSEVEVKKENLWKADLKVADVIFVYSLKKSIKKFEDFIYKNAQKGTRVIVNTNSFPTKKHIKSENGIFLYEV